MEPRFDAEIVVNDLQKKELTIRFELNLTHKVERESRLYHRLCTQPWSGILFGCQHLEPKNTRSRGAFVMVVDDVCGHWERIVHLNIIDIETHWDIQASRPSFLTVKRIIRLG